MKRTFFILSVVFFLGSILKATEISGILKAEMDIKKMYSEKKLSYVPNYIKNSRNYKKQMVFLHFTNKPNSRLLEKISNFARITEKFWIPPCKSHPNGFLLATIDNDYRILEELSRIKEIKRISSAEGQLRYFMDIASVETGAAYGWDAPFNLTGEGVKIGIIDSGFDIEHPDIPEPIVGIDFSTYPDSNFTIDNSQTGTGHGTHVAGIVIGQGIQSNGVWKGMAPNADFYAYKVGEDGSGGVSDAALAYSIYASAYNYHNDLVNISIGGFGEFMDGSEELDQTIDYASEAGTMFFCATGNDADSGLHFSGSLEAGEISDFIAVNYADSTDSRNVIYVINLVWIDDEDPSIQKPMNFEFYNHNMQPLVIQTIYDMNQSDRGTQSRMGVGTVLGTNTFFLKVENESDIELDYHLYITSYNGSFSNADPDYTVASPALADKAFAVGSWTTRNEILNWQSLSLVYDFDLNDITSFSNRGPRIDGMIKPDIAAPGALLIAPRDNDAWNGPPFGYMTLFVISNSYANDPNGVGLPADYIALMGTSMASPAAMGTVALLKERFPDLTREEIIEIVHTYSKEDSFTGETPNSIWGYGKIDLEEILNSVSVADDNENVPFEPRLRQNYPNPFNISSQNDRDSGTRIDFSIPQDSETNLCIFNIKGEKLITLTSEFYKAGNYSIYWDGKDDNGRIVSTGIYYYKLATSRSSKVRKMLILK